MGLTLIRWPETRHHINTSFAPYLPDVQEQQFQTTL